MLRNTKIEMAPLDLTRTCFKDENSQKHQMRKILKRTETSELETAIQTRMLKSRSGREITMSETLYKPK